LRFTTPLLALIPALCLIATAAVSQSEKQQPSMDTLRLSVEEVPLDVIVVDRNGRPALNLKKDDFTVFEDGVPQEIRHFSALRRAALETGSSGTQPVGTERHSEWEPGMRKAAGRTFVIFIGRGRHRFARVILSLIDFIRNGLEPSDLVAFMAFGRATDFTTDHERLIPFLERYRKVAPSIEAQIEMRSKLPALRFADPKALGPRDFKDEIDQIFNVENGSGRTVPSPWSPSSDFDAAHRRDRPKRIEDETPGDRRGLDAPEKSLSPLSEEIEDSLVRDGIGLDDYLKQQSDAEWDFAGLLSAIEFLRFVQGEKHILFLNDQGLATGRLADDRGLASVASDARVRVHAIQIGGQFHSVKGTTYSAAYADVRKPRQGRPFPGTLQNAFFLKTVKQLAGLTGGQSFIHRSLSESLKAVAKTTAVSYLVGYVSSNPELDGGFRRIEVRVTRPGMRTMHRRGYYAVPIPVRYDRAQLIVHSRTAAAAGAEELVDDIELSLRTKAVDHSGTISLRSSLEVVPTADLYTLEDGLYVGKLAISYFVFDREGNLLVDYWDNLDMSLKPETFRRVLEGGFPLEKELELPRGTADGLLRVVVYDLANDRLGSVESRIGIESVP